MSRLVGAQGYAFEGDARVARGHVYSRCLDQAAVSRIDGVDYRLGAVIGTGDAVILIAHHQCEGGRRVRRSLRDVPVRGGIAGFVSADILYVDRVDALARAIGHIYIDNVGRRNIGLERRPAERRVDVLHRRLQGGELGVQSGEFFGLIGEGGLLGGQQVERQAGNGDSPADDVLKIRRIGTGALECGVGVIASGCSDRCAC